MQYYSFFKIFIVRSAEFLELYNVPDPIFKVDPTKVKPQVPLFFYCIFTDNRYSGGGSDFKGCFGATTTLHCIFWNHFKK